MTGNFIKISAEVLTFLSKRPEIVAKEFPDIFFRVNGEELFWNTLTESDGWRVQSHQLTGNCRLLDAENYRLAYGTEEMLLKKFKTIQQKYHLASGAEKNYALPPNIAFPTMGGKVFWNDIAQYQGWRIQQNIFTEHCRILDENNIRRAWGSKEEMVEEFEKYKFTR